MTFEEQMIERLEALLHTDGIIAVKREKKLLSAWVTELVEGQDYKVPLNIVLLPYEGGAQAQWELHILFTLARNISIDQFTELSIRLQELNARADTGNLLLLPTCEICYTQQILLQETDLDAAMETAESTLQLMLLFLMNYYLYILLISSEPNRFTLKQYREKVFEVGENQWHTLPMDESLSKPLIEYLRMECEQAEATADGIAFFLSYLSGEEHFKAAGKLKFFRSTTGEAGERMELRMLLLDQLPAEHLHELRLRMQDLSRQMGFGYFSIEDDRRLIYRLSCPMHPDPAEFALPLLQSYLYEIVSFLDIYYPYLIISAMDPDRMNWSAYVEQLLQLSQNDFESET